MALTKAQVREILSAAGVDDEHMSKAVNDIISGHTASIEALREERDTLKDKASKADELEKENAALKKDAEKYKGKDYEALQKEFDDYKDGIAKKEVRGAKEAAFTQCLKDAGVSEKHFAKIIKYSDIDGLELDDKGKLVNAKDVMKSIKDEWSDHIVKSTTKGADTPTPPKTGGGNAKTMDEIMQIKDTKERQQAIKDHFNAQLQNDSQTAVDE